MQDRAVLEENGFRLADPTGFQDFAPEAGARRGGGFREKRRF